MIELKLPLTDWGKRVFIPNGDEEINVVLCAEVLTRQTKLTKINMVVT